MAMLAPVPPPVKLCRVLFNANERRVPRPFAVGLPDRERRAPYTEADRQWWAEQTRDATAPTESECATLELFRTMSPWAYRRLQEELREYDSLARQQDEYEADAANLALASEGC